MRWSLYGYKASPRRCSLSVSYGVSAPSACVCVWSSARRSSWSLKRGGSKRCISQQAGSAIGQVSMQVGKQAHKTEEKAYRCDVCKIMVH